MPWSPPISDKINRSLVVPTPDGRWIIFDTGTTGLGAWNRTWLSNFRPHGSEILATHGRRLIGCQCKRFAALDGCHSLYLVNRVEHQKLNQTTAELPFG